MFDNYTILTIILLCEDTSNCILLDILSKRCVVLPESVPFFFLFFLAW